MINEFASPANAMVRIGWDPNAVNSEMTVGGDVGEVRNNARCRILMWDPAAVFDEAVL
jgi:hypothetical protein